MSRVEELYQKFSLSTDPESIEHPYLSEDTNYMLAFAKWGEDLTINDLKKNFRKLQKNS